MHRCVAPGGNAREVPCDNNEMIWIINYYGRFAINNNYIWRLLRNMHQPVCTRRLEPNRICRGSVIGVLGRSPMTSPRTRTTSALPDLDSACEKIPEHDISVVLVVPRLTVGRSAKPYLILTAPPQSTAASCGPRSRPQIDRPPLLTEMPWAYKLFCMRGKFPHFTGGREFRRWA